MGLCLSILSSVWSVILEHEIFSLTETTDTVVVRSVSFGRKEGELVLRTFSFKNRQLENTPPKLEDEIHVSRGTNVKAVNNKTKLEILVPEPFVLTSPKPLSELDAAATKLQKVYKSYRTRRNLADCAVVVEELWWKALDSAALERSSVSFFDESKHETAISRWARARTKAAKVGKGLSKDEHAQKLALQHWLEAIDPRHRYGHNLHFYYDVWSGSMSSQPFFYWLDVGDGKEVNVERCPRVVMQRQCIKYLGPNERESYQVIVKDGKLVYKQNDMLLNTSEGAKWIFVLSTSRALFIGQKKKGVFQHSSFMSGGAITAAGRLVARDGILEAIWPYSGHYLPTEDNFKEFIHFLEEYNLDLSNVKRYTVDDAKTSYGDIPEESNKEMVQESSITDASANADASSSEVSQATNVETIEEPKFSLAKRLSCKWTSGVGPRIGCVRDYPMQLQSQALEKVNLSPRNTPARLTNGFPIPSPRPSPKVRMSPGLTYMGLPSPRVTA